MTVNSGPNLADYSYEILPTSAYETAFRFGRGTKTLVDKFDAGTHTIDENQVPNPRRHGTRFGREYYRGMVITFVGDIWTVRTDMGDSVAAFDELAKLRGAFKPVELLTGPGMITALRMRRAGRTRRVYGRPGQLSATDGRGSRGWIPWQGSFRCIDQNFYDDAEYSEIFPLIPTEDGGLTGPLIGPLIASGNGEANGLLIIRGDKPTWLTTRIYGPIANPVVTANNWSYHMPITLAYDEYVTIDPTPWNRKVRKSDGSNYSGKFDAASKPLSGMLLPPGPNSIYLQGTDLTATSKLEVFWRDVYSSY